VRTSGWIFAAIAAAGCTTGADTAPVQEEERYHPFQQDVRYRIEATQDEVTHVLTARARLDYTNNAPEAIERLYFHQYLNAFRPNSAWAEYDLRFDTRTFQDLGPEDHAFERIRSFVVDGRELAPVYPGAPDSTVFYVQLPTPLEPGASMSAQIDWEARLATEPRRQGREGNHYNYAHWYPRIAVYGADGWERRPHIRPGELNGTFAAYDVTLDLADRQVLGATGVPVEGDPGWEGAAVEDSEAPLYLRSYYEVGAPVSLGLLEGSPADGRKRIRWYADKVHNFAWSTSPDYAYRGGRWQGKPIHLLWEPSSEGWDAERIMEEQVIALDWVEELFGEYPWPQITVTDRVEGGATEFPMLYMTSGGAVVHETMHMIAHGVLANNEWREGWLDEGMASFLTNWLREERGAPTGEVWGSYTRLAQRDVAGEGEPVGLPGADFSSYAMYSSMTYGKGAAILVMLRDMLGEEVFREGLREYYERHRFHQVTREDFEQAMEDVSGRELDGYFDQWLETTFWVDYSVADVTVEGEPGAYTVTVEVAREGEAWMPVVVAAGDARETLEGRERTQTVVFELEERPEAIVLDPMGTLFDPDRENNVREVR